jgi:hypothetical protein
VSTPNSFFKRNRVERARGFSGVKFSHSCPSCGFKIRYLHTGTVSLHSSGKIWVESPGCDEQTCPGSRFHIRLKV